MHARVRGRHRIRLATARFHDHDQPLGPGAGIVRAEGGRIAHPFGGPRRLLDLGRGQIAAGADDQVLAPPGDEQLAPFVEGRAVRSLAILDPLLRAERAPRVAGRTLERVYRSGKRVLFEFSPLRRGACPLVLAVHLRMTGRLLWDSGSVRNAHDHLRARFRLDGGDTLHGFLFSGSGFFFASTRGSYCLPRSARQS